jgi:SPP1 family phage portal protein
MRKGIPKIKIPIRPSELSIEGIEKYLNSVFSDFEKNAASIRKDYDMYCLDHAILGKVRAHNDTEINNIVLIPDLKAKVDWKTGYVFGNPIKYAQNKTSDTDDINYLNKYVRSACQRAVDKEVGTWAYATGVGYYFIEPKSNDFSIESEAPYVLYALDSDTCAKVYSSFVGNEPLFDLIYTVYDEINADSSKQKVKVLDIYLPDALYNYEKRAGDITWVRKSVKPRGIAKPLPLVEKRFNPDGIGIVAMGESMQYAVDHLVSNGLDNIEDIVNQIIVYKNCNLGDTDDEKANSHRTGMRNGCLVLNSASKDFPADVDTLKTELSLSEVRELFSIINEKFHSALGVPMATSNTNSGGTTKSGSEVANGYENAYNRALDDINTFIKADTELLQKIMWICQNTPDNKIDNLAASDIEIKYSLNLTDNILTKTQSYVNLVQTGVPPTIALRLCKLSNDPEAEGKLIDDYKAKQAEAIATQQPTTEKIEVEKNGNNSQE